MKNKINAKLIKTLNPCQDRLDNFVNHYKDKSFTIKEFLALTNITHNDKIWVAFRLMPKKNIRFAAGHIAKSVLSIYELSFPKDYRPRNAIKEAVRPKLNKEAIHAATSAAGAAANSAATSANSAATSAYYAAFSAATSASEAAGCAAAAYATNATSQQQRDVHLKIIAKYWK